MTTARTAEQLAALMASAAHDPGAQLRQTRARCALVGDWQIATGARVLEIGCGQGDTTAVLANAVGDGGRVTAVDPGDPAYGAPVSLGASTRHLLDGPLGGRIDLQLSFDVLDPVNAFADDAFDVVVLAHCTWYFASLAEIADTLRAARAWAPRLCLSEWELEPGGIEQAGHLLAVLIQGQIEAFTTESVANVRTPYSRETLHALLHETGWRAARETPIDWSGLDDGRWEVESCLRSSRAEIAALDLPARPKELLSSQLDVLARLHERGLTRSLPAYSVVAERADVRRAPARRP
jgi:SAM-dependent methyltransferase